MSFFNILSLILPTVELDNIPLSFEVAYTLDNDEIQVGDYITVDTMFYGKQTGRVDRIVESPYYGQDGYCAYIVSLEGAPVWTEYAPLETAVLPC